MSMGWLMRITTLLGVVVSLGGCTLVVGDKVDRLVPDSNPDLRYELVAFEPHEGQLTELMLVNDEGFTQARAIYDPLLAADVVIELRNVVEPTVRRVDFYSDLNENGMLDGSTEDPLEPGRRLFPDHMWRDMVAEDGTGRFSHGTNFVDIAADDPAQDIGGPLVVRLLGVDAQIDQFMRVSVTDPSDREVGVYELGSIDTSPVEIEIPGIIDDGTEYRVEVEIADGPPRCVVARGDADGLTVERSVAELGDCGG